jgi:hypothetical protein
MIRSLLTTVSVLLVSALSAATAREWTDSTGQHKVEAEFAGLANGVVSLKKPNGRVIEVPIDKLSRADQRFARGAAASNDKATPPEKTAGPSADGSWITFKHGTKVPTIALNKGLSGPYRLPKDESLKAKAGTSFYIVECMVNFRVCPKRRIDFLNRDGVNIKSDEITLKTRDGKTFHPTYAAFGKTLTSKQWSFDGGPLRNVGMLETKVGIGENGKRPEDNLKAALEVHIARSTDKKGEIFASRTYQFSPDFTAVGLCFAFETPTDAEVESVALSGR